MITNQTNYAQRYARIAHLADANMTSFHKYLAAETDDFTAWNNLDELDLDEVRYDHFKAIDALSAKVVVEPGYSGRQTEGKHYRQTKDLSMNEITKLIREELAIQFPGCSFSVKQDNGSMHYALRCIILGVDFDPVAKRLRDALKGGMTYAQYANEVNRTGGFGRNDTDFFSDDYIKFEKKAEKIFQQYNYNDSDISSDYFSVRYYGHVTSLDLPTYLAHEADPALKARQAEADKAQKKLDKAATEARKADNLTKYGPYKKGDMAYYVASYDQRQGCFKKGDLLPCEILKVPNGRARFGGSFTIRLYYPFANVRENQKAHVKRLIKPGFEGEYVYFNQLDYVSPKDLQPLNATSEAPKLVDQSVSLHLRAKAYLYVLQLRQRQNP